MNSYEKKFKSSKLLAKIWNLRKICLLLLNKMLTKHSKDDFPKQLLK